MRSQIDDALGPLSGKDHKGSVLREGDVLTRSSQATRHDPHQRPASHDEGVDELGVGIGDPNAVCFGRHERSFAHVGAPGSGIRAGGHVLGDWTRIDV